MVIPENAGHVSDARFSLNSDDDSDSPPECLPSLYTTPLLAHPSGIHDNHEILQSWFDTLAR